MSRHSSPRSRSDHRSSTRKQNRFSKSSNPVKIESLERRQMLADAVAGGFVLDLPPEATYVGPAKFIYKTGGFLTAKSTANPRDIALNWAKANYSAFGLATTDVRNAVIADSYKDADTGITHVYLKQSINGLLVDNSDMAINVMNDGRILSVSSNFVSIPKIISATPALTVSQGLQKAADQLQLKLTRAPQILKQPEGIKKISSLQAAEISTEAIPAEVHYVATSKGVRLTWQYNMDVPGGEAIYTTNVDAASGELLYTTNHVSWYIQPGKALQFGDGTNAQLKPIADGSQTGGLSSVPTTYNAAYNVYPLPLASPSDGARDLVTNPWSDASPYGWHDTDADVGAESEQTVGNNVDSHEDRDANNSGGIRATGGTLSGDGSGNLLFDFPIDFALEPTTANNQLAAITNLFYWNNTLHDVYYRYGFTEAARNFQQNNYGNPGVAGDPVQADAQDGSGTNNANFASNTDGTDGRMQMYLFTAPTPDRDGDLDAEVMAHEYGHGVSNRMSGTGSGLTATQSRGMGEGWGDYFGLMLTLTDGSVAAQNLGYGVGTYVLNQPLTGPGIRRQRYSYDMSINTQTFGWYGTGGSNGGSTEVHNTGELWVCALWDMTWNLIRKHGFNPDITEGYNGTQAGNGNNLAMKLVFEGIKNHGANPTFIQARDGILAADVALTGGQNARELWLAFARRGLGFSASTASSTSTTFNEAFDLPPTLLKPFVLGHTPGAVADAALSNVTFNFSRPMDTTSFSVVDDLGSFSGPGGDMTASITGFSWTNSQTLAVNFTPTRDNGSYSMTIGPNILDATGGAMDQDGNNTAGEPTDAYTANFSKSGSGGPRITSSTPSGSISSPTFSTIDMVFSEPMDQTSFSVANDVISFTGPGGADLTSAITGFTWTNATTLRLNLTPRRAVGSYNLVVGPNVTASVDGVAMDQDSNGTAGEASDSYAASITKTGAGGPRITSQTPTGNVVQPTFASIDLIFSEAMDQTSFDVASDIVSFTAPGGINLKPSISGFTWQNSTTLRVNFASQSTDGTYNIVVAPTVLASIDGTAMDQDSNGTAGETPGDNYSGAVSIDRFPGPDAGGYEASPVALQNIDLVIGAPGVTTVINGSDDAAGTITLPAGNSFTYYGTNYTTLFPNANGLITFGTSTTAFTNTDLTTSPTQASIAILWDDWRTDTTGPAPATDSAVLWKIEGNNLIIEWSDVPNRTASNGTATFQAILGLNTSTRNGDVIANYVDIAAGTTTGSPPQTEGQSSTVGIKGAGTQGASRLLIGQNPVVGSNQFIGTGKAIRWTATAASGQVFADDNGNGTLDAGENAVANAHIYCDANNNGIFDAGEAAVYADASGNYSMTSLFDGDNFLRIDLGDYINTQPNPSVNLLMGENGTNRHIGVFDTALVGTAGADTLTISDNSNRVEIVQAPGRSYSILDAVLNKLSWDGLGGGDTVSISTGPSLKLIGSEDLASLSIDNGASAFMPAGTNSLLQVDDLDLDGTSTLDLNDNDLLLDYSGASQLAAIQSLINAARNGGAWDGTGLTSTAAKNNAQHNTTLGAMEGSDYPGGLFNGVAVPGGSVLVKYTYYGDTDFNGQVNFDDYSRTDAGFNGSRTGWFNGDFDGNGVINFDDYGLLDLAFNSQGDVL